MILKINLLQCYSNAWAGFKKGWIILCLISGFIVAFEFLPRLTVRGEWNELKTSTATLLKAMNEGDSVTVEKIAVDIQFITSEMTRVLLKWLLYLFPVIAVLTILLLMRANKVVKLDSYKTRSFQELLFIALVHVILAVLKLGAFFFLIVPGVYLYVKLLFVSLILLEEDKSPLDACRISWKMTEGNFFGLFWLVFFNTLIQAAAAFTIIGLIPATGFVNIARAAAFQTIRQVSSSSPAV